MSDSFFHRYPAPPAPVTLGWELLADYPDEARIEMAFNPNGTMLNAGGSVQGGFVAAMLDEVMGPALVSSSNGQDMPVTIDMNVTFIRPVKPERVIGKGRVVSRTKSTAFLEGELFDIAGNLVARATSTARIVPMVIQ
jgi:uncharacterized protein (TIGR00369 family)